MITIMEKNATTGCFASALVAFPAMTIGHHVDAFVVWPPAWAPAVLCVPVALAFRVVERTAEPRRRARLRALGDRVFERAMKGGEG